MATDKKHWHLLEKEKQIILCYKIRGSCVWKGSNQRGVPIRWLAVLRYRLLYNSKMLLFFFSLSRMGDTNQLNSLFQTHLEILYKSLFKKDFLSRERERKGWLVVIADIHQNGHIRSDKQQNPTTVPTYELWDHTTSCTTHQIIKKKKKTWIASAFCDCQAVWSSLVGFITHFVIGFILFSFLNFYKRDWNWGGKGEKSRLVKLFFYD